MMTATQKADAVRTYAQQCNGSEDFNRHPLARLMLYTNGVRYVAETCGAWWLVDAIASYVATHAETKAEDFQVWTLKVHEVCGRTMLVCTNGNDDSPVIVSQEISYTDFPRELMPFRLFCEAGGIPHPKERRQVRGHTLMLPEER